MHKLPYGGFDAYGVVIESAMPPAHEALGVLAGVDCAAKRTRLQVLE